MREQLHSLQNLTDTHIKRYPEVKQRNEFDRKRILIAGGAGMYVWVAMAQSRGS